MKFRDQTDMGGTRGAFLTTHWSLIEGVKDGSGRDGALIELLLRTYWKPVYCYLRRKGYGNEQAKDLTQDFFLSQLVLLVLLDRRKSWNMFLTLWKWLAK